LRAPILPILGLAQVLRDKEQQQDDREQKRTENNDDLLNVIIRNARLQQLTEKYWISLKLKITQWNLTNRNLF
jgi:hypothetical protein